MSVAQSAGGRQSRSSPAPPAALSRNLLSSTLVPSRDLVKSSIGTDDTAKTSFNIPSGKNPTELPSVTGNINAQSGDIHRSLNLFGPKQTLAPKTSIDSTPDTQESKSQAIFNRIDRKTNLQQPLMTTNKSTQSAIVIGSSAATTVVNTEILGGVEHQGTHDAESFGTFEPSLKRSKVENLSEESSRCEGVILQSSTVKDIRREIVHDKRNFQGSSLTDCTALQKRILAQKFLRLRNVKEKHSEHVAELYYLQNNGNMMDYPTWRKKPPTSQYIYFTNSYRLDHLVNEAKTTVITATIANSPSVRQTSKTPITLDGMNTIICGIEIKSSVKSDLYKTEEPKKTPNEMLVEHQEVSSIRDTLPCDAEIKIPAVGATPVAVSTKLPAAVVQLSQKGHIPGRPLGGRHGMVFGQISTPNAIGFSSVPLVPGGTPLLPCNNVTGSSTIKCSKSCSPHVLPGSVPTNVTPVASSAPSFDKPTQKKNNFSSPCTTSVLYENSTNSLGCNVGNNVQEVSYKAKQEVYVMQRVSELQREGLWTEKRLPKLQEPCRNKSHWDYLLEEMVWLAADFAQERKWKKNAAKKCAKMVQKYFQDKANAAHKAEKAQEAQLKRIANFISREVKMFWSNVEKLVDYKHNAKMEEKRKKALDQHLSLIVDQTEKFSQQLAEGMNKNCKETVQLPTKKADILLTSNVTSESRHNNSDEEFLPVSGSDDDEETIAKAEEDVSDIKTEIAELKKESEMDLSDFLKDLPEGYLENRETLIQQEESKLYLDHIDLECNGEDADAEFEALETSEDDEGTLVEQEEIELGIDYKKEIDELEADNDLSVEELLKKYKAGNNNYEVEEKVEEMEIDSDDNIRGHQKLGFCESALECYDDSDDMAESDEENYTSSESDENEIDALKTLFNDNETPSSKDDMIKDAAALAESIQPKGNTLSSTNVVTPVPFLLKYTLREYQHIGLDWLVTMYERKLNGILADEMGLGKTIQTIALLAHLACEKGNWGPHLIVVPSSVMLNWEMEFKKWCPGFKILTYYGSQKERKAKRVGWTKPNAFHVCITSYKLVVQDQQSFRRKKWKYLILDEAQNIKNFKSQRWQLLLNFSTERRLLLTGTPLQNDLMELWSLMHFLMPYVFSSHREFKEWFSNPMTGMIEGNMEYNETLINRLHKVIRPFLLRRLKKEVEKQMPKKYEHIVMCRLSNRQRYLYDDFMSRTKTKETLQTGNLLSVINILMQLRKVCNHPNMFEVRPIISPFQMNVILLQLPALVFDLFQYDPFMDIDLNHLNLNLLGTEILISAYVSYKWRQLLPRQKLIQEIDAVLPLGSPICPKSKYKFQVRVRDQEVQNNLSKQGISEVKVGASPTMKKTEGNQLVATCNNTLPFTSRVGRLVNYSLKTTNTKNIVENQYATRPPPLVTVSASKMASLNLQNYASTRASGRISRLSHDGKPYLVIATAPEVDDKGACIRIIRRSSAASLTDQQDLIMTKSSTDHNSEMKDGTKTEALVTHLAQHVRSSINSSNQKNDIKLLTSEKCDENYNAYNMQHVVQQRKQKRQNHLKVMALINKRRSEATPIYGCDFREAVEKLIEPIHTLNYSTWLSRSYTNCCRAMNRRYENWTLNNMLKTYEQRCLELRQSFSNFILYVPAAYAPRHQIYVSNLASPQLEIQRNIETCINTKLSSKLTLLHPVITAMSTQFPDPCLIQYDCGKLQTLDTLLRQLKSEHHRVLIFTQMTKMLDVLETFLNYHGHIYLRLDGSTRVEQRQVLMERFNGDMRIFCFILSTRSGGVGVNLTGADTVIFYDSDWNPTMDAQAQDRCHRIGQTRDVHIYRLVSEKTIEVNILKKANQKRMLSDMAIEGGNFTTSYLKSSTIKDLFNVEIHEQSDTHSQDKVCDSLITINENEKQSLKAFESALAEAEDEQDVQATKSAKAEAAADLAEFDETIPIDEISNETPMANVGEISKTDLEIQNLVKQLSPIERYAMRFVEETAAAWTAKQIRAAEAEIEAQKREWEANRLAALKKEQQMLQEEKDDIDAESDNMFTYNRRNGKNQVVNKSKHNEQSSTLRERSYLTSKLRSNFNISKVQKRKVWNSKTASHSVAYETTRVKTSSKCNAIKTNRFKKRRNSVCVRIRRSSSSGVNNTYSIDRKLNAPLYEFTENGGITQQNQTIRADLNVLEGQEFDSSLFKSNTGVINQKLLNIARRKQLRKVAETKKESYKKGTSPSYDLSVLNANSRRVLRNHATKQSEHKESANITLYDGNKQRVKRKNSGDRKNSNSCYENQLNNKDPTFKEKVHYKIEQKSQCSDQRNNQKNANMDSTKGEGSENCLLQASDPKGNLSNFKALILEKWKTLSPQIKDTCTNSACYVSEESDENHQLSIQANMNKRNRNLLSGVSTHTSALLSDQNVDINSPRTRSRGAVKIDLWTLDVSPVLPTFRSFISRSNKKEVQKVNDAHKNCNKKIGDFEKINLMPGELLACKEVDLKEKSRINALSLLQSQTKNKKLRSFVGRKRRKTNCLQSVRDEKLYKTEFVKRNKATFDQWVARNTSQSKRRNEQEILDYSTSSSS